MRKEVWYMNYYELIAFIVYFVLVIGVGIYFFVKGKDSAGEKDYFLGGRLSAPGCLLHRDFEDFLFNTEIQLPYHSI